MNIEKSKVLCHILYFGRNIFAKYKIIKLKCKFNSMIEHLLKNFWKLKFYSSAD